MNRRVFHACRKLIPIQGEVVFNRQVEYALAGNRGTNPFMLNKISNLACEIRSSHYAELPLAKLSTDLGHIAGFADHPAVLELDDPMAVGGVAL
jgi:hypothetical protein